MPRSLRGPSRLLPFALAAFAGIAAAAPTAVCRPVPDSIKIDGVLDEPYWKNLDTLTLVKNNDPAGGAPSEGTQVLQAWSKTRLYVAFIVQSRDVKNTVTQHDGPLYDQDVVEMFLDPDGDQKNYIELEWNCLNTSFDAVFAAKDGAENDAWAPKGMQNAVKVHGTANKSNDVDTGMTVEISIPWTDLQPYSKAALPPKDGDRLPLDFYRIKYVSGAAELMAWSPTGAADFHRPDKFGALIFSETVTSALRPRARAWAQAKVAGPGIPGLNAAIPSAARRADGRFSPLPSGWLFPSH